MQNTKTLEEAELTDTTNEKQTEPTPTTQPEVEQSVTTALVSTEPEVIEGEVIEIEPPQAEPAEEYPPPKQKPYWLLIPCTILLCLLFLAASFLVPLLTPTATVLIIPREQHISTTTAIQIHGRVLPLLTLEQSDTVPATGHGHQDATYAQGTITFYNGLSSQQTIAEGTILTGSDGVRILTTVAATIPPARNTTPPTFGHVTVPAHALITGAQGNISAYDINGSCCAPSVLVKNTTSFTGGHNQRDYTIVVRGDIATAASDMKTTLLKSENAALQAQLHPGEQLLSPSCNHHVQSNHHPGDEAREVTVTVSETCGGISYDAHNVDTNATQLITSEAVQRFGTGYSLIGDIHVSMLHATITDHTKGIATLALKIDATYLYQIREGVKEKLSTLLAGKPTQQAINTLLQFPGIQAASIQLAAGNTALPADPTHIHIIVRYLTS